MQKYTYKVTLLNCTFKNGLDGKYCYMYFTTNTKDKYTDVN